MAERLFGLETEYALAVLDRQGRRVDQMRAVEWLLEVARRRLIHLPDLHSHGLFLTNGARFYVDCGGHPEFAGPELANPWDAVRYVKAGERMLEQLVAELAGTYRTVTQVCLFRQNVDYSGAQTTWGSHESYLHKSDPALFRRHLIPHLVSRLIYTGSGGFDSSYPGIRFTLSPRVPHLTAEVSSQSTHTRGVLHTKDESLSSSGYHRLHLLCSESLYSELATYLKVGATALVVAMIEAGIRPADRLVLSAPLQAMRTFAGDPRCQFAVSDSHEHSATALGIQRHYLTLAESHVSNPFMPPWAAEVCRQWRHVLDQLEAGCPDSVATSLDWAIRFKVFDQFLRAQGYSWQMVQRWNVLVDVVAKSLLRAKPPPDDNNLEPLSEEEELRFDEMLPQMESLLDQRGASFAGFKQFRALRSQLFELDTRFGELGEKGLFAQLEHAGVLQQHLPGVDNFEHAMEHPPAIGRANIRGNCVRRLGSPNCPRARYACDWASVWDQVEHRLLDLSDPFARQEEWKNLPMESRHDPNRLFTERRRRVFEMLRTSILQ